MLKKYFTRPSRPAPWAILEEPLVIPTAEPFSIRFVWDTTPQACFYVQVNDCTYFYQPTIEPIVSIHYVNSGCAVEFPNLCNTCLSLDVSQLPNNSSVYDFLAQEYLGLDPKCLWYATELLENQFAGLFERWQRYSETDSISYSIAGWQDQAEGFNEELELLREMRLQ